MVFALLWASCTLCSFTKHEDIFRATGERSPCGYCDMGLELV